MSAHRLFGIELDADLALPGRTAQGPEGGVTVRLHRLGLAALEAAAPRLDDAGTAWRTRIDGRAFMAAPGGGGTLHMAWGDDCRFRFDAAGRTLEWAAPDPSDRGWQRMLLDTVAYLMALALGAEALHAAGVAVDGSAVAIAGPSGMGKSTLTAELLGRGAELVADDILVLRGDGRRVEPGPGLMTLPAGLAIEGGHPVHGLGAETWTEVPVVDAAPELGAIVLLHRGDGLADGVERVPPSLRAVLPHLLGFPRTPERLRRRFELAAELAERVPVYRLTAGTATPPATLAARVLEIVRQVRVPEPSEVQLAHR